jgi:hypothetical protein
VGKWEGGNLTILSGSHFVILVRNSLANTSRDSSVDLAATEILEASFAVEFDSTGKGQGGQ